MIVREGGCLMAVAKGNAHRPTPDALPAHPHAAIG